MMLMSNGLAKNARYLRADTSCSKMQTRQIMKHTTKFARPLCKYGHYLPNKHIVKRYDFSQ